MLSQSVVIYEWCDSYVSSLNVHHYRPNHIHTAWIVGSFRTVAFVSPRWCSQATAIQSLTTTCSKCNMAKCVWLNSTSEAVSFQRVPYGPLPGVGHRIAHWMIQKPKFQRNQTQTFVSVILQKFKYKVTYGARLNTAFPNAPEQFQDKIRETRPHFTRLSSRNLIRLTCSRGVPLRYATCSNIQASSGFQNLSMSCLLPLSKVQARSLRTLWWKHDPCVVHGLPRLPWRLARLPRGLPRLPLRLARLPRTRIRSTDRSVAFSVVVCWALQRPNHLSVRNTNVELTVLWREHAVDRKFELQNDLNHAYLR